MAVALAFAGSIDFNNAKGLMFNATFTGNYGVNGVGDLMNLNPSQNGGADGGVTDPLGGYNLPITFPPSDFGVLNEALGGSYVVILPNANPSLTNFGLQMFEPGGAEKATNAAYTAAELAGTVKLVFFVPLQ